VNIALAGEIVGRYGSAEERLSDLKLCEIATAQDGNYFARLQAMLALDFIEATRDEIGSQNRCGPHQSQ
jgi:hypothetical protein